MKNSMHRPGWFLVLLLAPGLLQAQSFDAEKFLMQIAIVGQVPGGYGSLWETRLTLVNHGDSPVLIGSIDPGCAFQPCILQPVAADSTLHALFGRGGEPGTFLLVERDRADQVAVQLRIQDVSRQSQTWGTELPVVRERDALSTEAELLDIPVDPSFRALLRVYDFQPSTGHSVLVRVFHTDPKKQVPRQQVVDPLLAEFTLSLQPPEFPLDYPGYAQVTLWNLAGLPTTGRLRVEITPVEPGLRFWGFVSVTNNETQHVTTITPR
jgi:hypothetical protein